MAEKPAPDPSKIAELKRRLAREPASRSFLELAREYHEAGQLEEASVVCAQGLKYHPSYLSARVLLGRIYFDMGRVEDSKDQMETVLSNAPDNLVARKVLAEICLEQGDAAGAMDRLRALLAFNPADSDTRKKIAVIEARLRDPEAAAGVAAVNEPTPAAARPEGPTGSVIAATNASVPAPAAGPELQIIEDTGETPVAATRPDPAAMDPARTIRPLDSGVLATPTLAEIYMQQGLPQKAVQVYREILRGDPYNTEAQARLAELGGRPGPAVPDPATLACRRKIQTLRSWLDRIHRHAGRTGSRAGALRS